MCDNADTHCRSTRDCLEEQKNAEWWAMTQEEIDALPDSEARVEKAMQALVMQGIKSKSIETEVDSFIESIPNVILFPVALLGFYVTASYAYRGLFQKKQDYREV